MPRTHLVIPDTQCKPGVDNSFLRAIGNYAVDKKPDVVVQLGDFADMESLSSYDVGKKSFEGRRYKHDIESAHECMDLLMAPFSEFNDRAKKNKTRQYHPQFVLTLGNHEDRISRVINSDPKLDGTLSLDDLRYADWGWQVIPFLQPVVIDGVCYSHYFTSGIMGRPVGSARNLVIKKHMSCIQGHVQNWEMHREVRGDGQPIIGLFAGSCYLHDEDYLGPQGNNYARGIWVLHEVDGLGDFQPMFVSLKFLLEKYL